jgi:hypothetical protein
MNENQFRRLRYLSNSVSAVNYSYFVEVKNPFPFLSLSLLFVIQSYFRYEFCGEPEAILNVTRYIFVVSNL